MLVIHMASAEAGWIAKVTQTAIPSDLSERLLPGRQDASGDLPPYSADKTILVDACRAARETITKPALAAVENMDAEVPDQRRPMTVRGVLMHLVWHWTYHSGQVGLLRRMWGDRYQWTFDRRVGDPRPS
jgi:uncharacterized damage-inducible protein DinB